MSICVIRHCFSPSFWAPPSPLQLFPVLPTHAPLYLGSTTPCSTSQDISLRVVIASVVLWKLTCMHTRTHTCTHTHAHSTHIPEHSSTSRISIWEWHGYLSVCLFHLTPWFPAAPISWKCDFTSQWLHKIRKDLLLFFSLNSFLILLPFFFFFLQFYCLFSFSTNIFLISNGFSLTLIFLLVYMSVPFFSTAEW